jgi:hypothetical protein
VTVSKGSHRNGSGNQNVSGTDMLIRAYRSRTRRTLEMLKRIDTSNTIVRARMVRRLKIRRMSFALTILPSASRAVASASIWVRCAFAADA